MLCSFLETLAREMTTKRPLDLDLTVDHLMRDRPEAVAVFVRRRMLCVGCPIGPFHTLADACRAYSLDQAEFRSELAAAIEEYAA